MVKLRLTLLLVAPVCLGIEADALAQNRDSARPETKVALTLKSAMETGLRENLTIRVARADALAAIQETHSARSQTRPQVSTNAYLTYGDSPNLFYSAPGVMPTNFLAAPQQGQADLNLTLMAPLSTGGRLNALVKAARARERAMSSDVNGVIAETALQIRDAYYRALLAIERSKVASAKITAVEELLRTTRLLFEAGKGLEANVRRVEAEKADAQRNLTNAQNTIQKALLDLKMTMAARLDSDISLVDSLTFVPPSDDLKANLETAARSRSELLSARQRLAATRYQNGAAKGAREPQVYGMAMLDSSASQTMGAHTGYGVGIVVSMPLVDGGERRAEIARTRAVQERATAELQDIERKVENEVRQAWLDVETASANYRTAQASLIAMQSAYEVMVLRVQNQKGLLVEQLDSLATLTQARSNVAEALYDHANAVARLDRAVGRH